MFGTIHLVTGANRGIGTRLSSLGSGIEVKWLQQGLSSVATILAKHNDAFVYDGVRKPDGASELKDLEMKYPGRVPIVRCESANSGLAMEMENDMEDLTL